VPPKSFAAGQSEIDHLAHDHRNVDMIVADDDPEIGKTWRLFQRSHVQLLGIRSLA
jgi:hypothetical protein